jgi:transcriptional regulator EpsA
VHTLLPHVLVSCGGYQRHRRGLVFECFHSVTVPEPLLNAFADADSPLMARVAEHWVQAGGKPCLLAFDDDAAPAWRADFRPLRDVGLAHLLVHGVARPQRQSEIESLFVFARPEGTAVPNQAAHLDLLLPHLHATYLRVLGVERELHQPPRAPASPGSEPHRLTITARERQVLQGVREGKSNQQISEALGISALTVKNHIQKILRKLGANNRAQAVALTMSMGLAPHPARKAEHE